MVAPSRFTGGLTSFPKRHLLQTFPVATNPQQIVNIEDFVPYRAGDYLVTNTNGTATPVNLPSGLLKLATAGSTAADVITILKNGNVAGGTAGLPYSFFPGSQLWANFRVAYPTSVGNTNDTAIRFGLGGGTTGINNVNAIFFSKASGGTAINLVIQSSLGTTTFQNIADIAKPSGLFGFASDITAILNATIAGNAFTAVNNTAVGATPGAGYVVAPLVLSTATSGVAGNIPVMAMLGSTAYSGSTGLPLVTRDIPYASVASPYIFNPGSGYTNGGPLNTLLEVEPVIDFSIYYDGKGTFGIAVNGREILSIGNQGIIQFAAGATINQATQTLGGSYYCTNTPTVGTMPAAQAPGSFFGCAPLGSMAPFVSVANTTANARAFYVAEIDTAVEYF